MAIERIVINVHWVKNRVWGMNPHAEADVTYDNGKFKECKARCSGCGYDKLSTVVADILNQCMGDYLKEKMEGKEKRDDFPRGIQRGYFEGGIGINCYTDKSESYGKPGVMQFLGYSCRHFTSNDNDFILIERKETNEKR